MTMDTTPSEHNTGDILNTWLTRREPASAYTAFQHISLAERRDLRETVFNDLANTVFIHHNDPGEFRMELENLGYPESACALDARPSSLNTRVGNFGEVLAAEYLRQCEGYQIPVYRLRYNPNPDSSMKGDDVLAFRFGDSDGRGREILVVETKARSQFRNEIVRKAYEQIEKSHGTRPKSILFVMRILHREGRDNEADCIRSFLNGFAAHQPTRKYMIFLVTGNEPRDPFGYIQDLDEVIDSLMAANVSISSLHGFVNALFDCEVWTDGP
jgi:hypothetical protein